MGKKTISFVATDKLADWLEEESEKRMTSVSSTVQQLLAEMYRCENVTETEETAQQDTSEVVEMAEQPDEGGDSPFDAHPDGWYEPGGQYDYAVYVPSDADIYDAGQTRYYKTRHGAAEALRRWYE